MLCKVCFTISTLLRVIQLSQNNVLTSVEPASLDSLADLEQVVLVDNDLLEDVHEDIVQLNTYLTRFDGRNNKIDTLPDFSGLQNLQEVSFEIYLSSTVLILEMYHWRRDHTSYCKMEDIVTDLVVGNAIYGVNVNILLSKKCKQYS